MADVDLDPGCTLNKKIRNAQLAQYNFILGQWQHTVLSLLSVTSSPYLLLAFNPDIDFFFLPFLFASYLVCGKKSGGREGEDEQHCERTHQG